MVAISQSKAADEGLTENLVAIRRVAKTVKGGRNMRFAALVVVGDGKGRVGYGTGKAREVPEAIRKATESGKRNMRRVPLREGRTLHHDTVGRFGAAKVLLRSAPPGTGIIAGGPMRAVFEALGIQDVVAKSNGTSNPNNMVKATFEAFEMFESPRHVGSRRGRKVADVISVPRDQATSGTATTQEESEEAATTSEEATEAPKTAKKPAAKKPAAKKADEKKAPAKKPAAKKSDEKKADTKPAAKKALAKKPETKKTTASKEEPKK